MRETITRKPDLLDEIFVIEQQSAAQLEAERSKAIAWLEQTAKEIDRTSQTEMEQLRSRAQENEAAAKAAASKKAAGIVDSAKALAARIDALKDETLQPIVRKHIACIVPEM
ncbi:MAG TPA: hypothetical protein VL284_10665 [Thermoanaerobaculia bacterium]|nr:hypothetical protein [Thermoanaerobaculia bacterium]